MNIVKNYLKKITKKYLQGDAREESYYEILNELLYEFADENNYDIDITTLPKRTEAGNPDFRIWDGVAHITGYIEAKKPETENLDSIQVSEQLERYITTFPNVILTNFHEFRLYRNGELIDRVSIARFFTLKELKKVPSTERKEDFFDFLNKFFSFSVPRLTSASALARELAKRTRFLREAVIKIELKEEQKESNKPITGFFHAFQKYLIYSLTKPQFADLYSQTITYGLFAARTRAGEDFNRELAYKYIPNTIGILRDIFKFISLEEPPLSLRVLVDDIAEILKVTHVKKILEKYYEQGKGKDPIIHFYETFLSEYDPAIREKRGVYYTPEPVVSYIVESLHGILKENFNLTDGFASHDVTVLDPAAGTLTFMAEAIKKAVHSHMEKYGSATISNLLKNSILKNFYAFELMMAPYAIGHLKMSFIFEELGYKLENDERFKLYLTNTLEMGKKAAMDIPGLSSLAEENQCALKVKRDEPVLVIMGNPPYSGISANNNEWTEKLLKTDIANAQSYYKIDGEDLGERNPKWLQDDYVKFLRFSQWKIQKEGKGVVGMITNHSYLDNPTFRGMRQSLMKTFDKIYILNLHGNSLKKEISPDGSKDENVFDIRQGVAIALMIKDNSTAECKIYYRDIFGFRNEKYDLLNKNSIDSVNYEEIEPSTPYYFFIKRDTESINYYLNWDKITDVFPLNGVGMTTARDKVVIDFEKNKLLNRILRFKHMEADDETLHKFFNIRHKKGWSIRKAWNRLQNFTDSEIEDKIKKVHYRVFDIRYIFYDDSLVWRTVKRLMRHMLAGENLGLISARSNKSGIMDHFFITDKIMETKCGERTTQSALFPLYIYNEKNSDNLMERMEAGKKANIADSIFNKLTEYYGEKPQPEEILQYIYGVFYSNVYREKYREFLKIDFPRIPFTRDKEIFAKMAKQGKKLIDLHLLESEVLDPPIARYEGSGDNDRIEKYEYKDGKVYINDDKYFEGIPQEVWEYQIGGYQVLRKYLRSRKGRTMQDARRYCRIATVLAKTIELQQEIDEIFMEIEESV